MSQTGYVYQGTKSPIVAMFDTHGEAAEWLDEVPCPVLGAINKTEQGWEWDSWKNGTIVFLDLESLTEYVEKL